MYRTLKYCPVDLKRLLRMYYDQWRLLVVGFISGCTFATFIIKWGCCSRRETQNVIDSSPCRDTINTNYSYSFPMEATISTIPVPLEESGKCISRGDDDNEECIIVKTRSANDNDSPSSKTTTDVLLLQQRQRNIADQLHEELLELIHRGNVLSLSPTASS